MIVERERERIAFNSAGYWDIEGTFGASDNSTFTASLISVDGAPAGDRQGLRRHRDGHQEGI